MNNKGFTYSFFLIFITLFLTIIADYLQDKVLLNTIENGIKDNINNTKSIEDFEIGDLVTISREGGITFNEITLSDESMWIVAGILFDNETTAEDDSMLILYNLTADSTSSSDVVSAKSIKDDLELSGDYNDTRVNELLLNAKANYILPNLSSEEIISPSCTKIELKEDSTLDINSNECSPELSASTYRQRIVIKKWNNKKVMVNPDDASGVTITGVA